MDRYNNQKTHPRLLSKQLNIKQPLITIQASSSTSSFSSSSQRQIDDSYPIKADDCSNKINNSSSDCADDAEQYARMVDGNSVLSDSFAVASDRYSEEPAVPLADKKYQIRQQERKRVRERQFARSDNQASSRRKSKEFRDSVRISIKSGEANAKVHTRICSADDQLTNSNVSMNAIKSRNPSEYQKRDTNAAFHTNFMPASVEAITSTASSADTGIASLVNRKVITNLSLDVIADGNTGNNTPFSMITMSAPAPLYTPTALPKLYNASSFGSQLRPNAVQYTPRNQTLTSSMSTQIEICSPTSSMMQSPPLPLTYNFVSNSTNEPYSRSIAQWLQTSNPDCTMVYPVWIGNLPSNITLAKLRTFVESKIGCVLISIYIGGGRSGFSDDRESLCSPSSASSLLSPTAKKQTYAFLNFPCFDKQTNAVKLLDNQAIGGFTWPSNENIDMCLIARAKRQSKFPFLNYSLNVNNSTVQYKYNTGDMQQSSTPSNSNTISEHFKYFKDSILPIIMERLKMLQNTCTLQNIRLYTNENTNEVTEDSVLQVISGILEENAINVNFLPNRLWCVECNLKNKCSRKYCSFHHSLLEKQLGEMFAKLVNKKYDEKKLKYMLMQQMQPPQITESEVIRDGRSRHTLFVQGLPDINAMNMGVCCAVTDGNSTTGICCHLKHMTPISSSVHHNHYTHGHHRSCSMVVEDGYLRQQQRYLSVKNAQMMHDRIYSLFETFGIVEQVIVNADQTCFLRMRYAQCAQVIEHLFRSNDNRTGIIIGFPMRAFITTDNAIYCGPSYDERQLTNKTASTVSPRLMNANLIPKHANIDMRNQLPGAMSYSNAASCSQTPILNNSHSYPSYMNVNSMEYLQRVKQHMQHQIQSQMHVKLQQMNNYMQQWQMQQMQQMMQMQHLMQNRCSQNIGVTQTKQQHQNMPPRAYAVPVSLTPVPNSNSTNFSNIDFENDAQQIYNQFHAIDDDSDNLFTDLLDFDDIAIDLEEY